MGNSKSKTNKNNSNKGSNNDTKLDSNLNKYSPINYRKIKKSGFRIGAHIDIGMKDFEAGMTFGKNNISEIHFSENNQHLKLLKSLVNEKTSDNKVKIINTLVDKLDNEKKEEK